MTDETAERFVQHLRTANAELARAIQVAKDECSADEFELWRERLGMVIGELFIQLLDPVYRIRPSLAQEGLRDRYPLPRLD
jgi:hypothetical protein